MTSPDTASSSMQSTQSMRSMLAEQSLRIGVDITRISAIQASLATFGTHFLRRVFSVDECAYALQAPALAGQRLAARFAAKEAAMKAFGLSDSGVAWTDLEVRRAEDGCCSLVLRGRAAEVAAGTGCTRFAVSLSHDGDYATAMVAAVPDRYLPRRPHPRRRPARRSGPTDIRNALAQGPDFETRRTSIRRTSLTQALDTIDAAVRAVLLKHGRLSSPTDALAGDADLYQAGLSSHASVNVMLALETEFDIEFPDRLLKRSVFASIASIRDAVVAVRQG